MGTSFTMMVTLKIDPDRMPQYLEALHDVLEPARNEPTNVFLYAYIVNEAGVVVLFERWVDTEVYLNEVLQTAHYRRYLSVTEPLYIAPREVRFLVPIEFESAPSPDG